MRLGTVRGTRARAAWTAALCVGGNLINDVGDQGQHVTDHEHDAGQHTIPERPGIAAVAQPLGFAGQMLGLGCGAHQRGANTLAAASTMRA
ncbi:hypothetical protein DBR42_08090 [Pelomonas sp. HMWF004]|nr:hypothetical protein DBR42_08090 [Pelomonas sp. HMWF004]